MSFRIELETEPVNCGPCVARDVCPAIKFMDNLSELNEDLDEASTVVEQNVEGAAFAYGFGKITREIGAVEKKMERCVGGVVLRRVDRDTSTMPDELVIAPVFGVTRVRQGYVPVETPEDLNARGLTYTDRSGYENVHPTLGAETTLADNRSENFLSPRGLLEILREAPNPYLQVDAINSLQETIKISSEVTTRRLEIIADSVGHR